jgi:hypothetical protein
MMPAKAMCEYVAAECAARRHGRLSSRARLMDGFSSAAIAGRLLKSSSRQQYLSGAALTHQV